MKNAEYVNVGKLSSTYGVKGWIKVLSFTEPLTNILDYVPWHIETNGHWSAVKVTDSREHGKSLIVKLANYDTPEQSRLLTGKMIAVLRSALPTLKQGDFYWHDLKGLTVINQDGKTLGEVIYLLATGANDVLVVKGEKEHAIPYLLDEVIIDIDLINKIMHVNWDVI